MIFIYLFLLPATGFAGFVKGFDPVTKSEKAQSSGSYPGTIWTEPVTGMEFVWVPKGCFMMGTPEGGTFDSAGTSYKNSAKDHILVSILKATLSSLFPVGCINTQTYNQYRYPAITLSPTKKSITLSPTKKFNMGTMDERPVHEVCLDGFWIGRYEVTQGQWQKIMGSNPSKFKSGDDYPVENISWNDAKKFISVLNQQSGKTFSLPTEAQWEYAARSGGKDQKFSGGSDVDRFAWYLSNSGKKTHSVGTKSPNDLGIYDMSGNVWEWCEDVYDANAYSKHLRNNPLVLSGGSYRVNRGGCWVSESRNVRCANRSRRSASYTFSFLGFRLLRKN